MWSSEGCFIQTAGVDPDVELLRQTESRVDVHRKASLFACVLIGLSCGRGFQHKPSKWKEESLQVCPGETETFTPELEHLLTYSDSDWLMETERRPAGCLCLKTASQH